MQFPAANERFGKLLLKLATEYVQMYTYANGDIDGAGFRQNPLRRCTIFNA